MTSTIKFAVALASILWKSWAWIHVLTCAEWLSWLWVLKKFTNLFSGCFCGSQTTVLLRQHVGCAIDFQGSRTSGGFKAFDVPWTCRPSCKLLGSRLLWRQASSGEGRIWREYSKIGKLLQIRFSYYFICGNSFWKVYQERFSLNFNQSSEMLKGKEISSSNLPRFAFDACHWDRLVGISSRASCGHRFGQRTPGSLMWHRQAPRLKMWQFDWWWN